MIEWTHPRKPPIIYTSKRGYELLQKLIEQELLSFKIPEGHFTKRLQ